jgi:REP element-mobilizing transposase RayT
MARPPRVHQPGLVFHVISRGNGRQNVFLEDADFRRFLDLLAKVKERTPFDLFAYCLMPNHFHLLIRVGRFEISRIMQQLLTRYACFFNAKRRRPGHLFQSRFKAKLCGKDSYLLELVRYIHLNPVRAKIVDDPVQWTWSGHREYLGLPGRRLADLDFIRSFFGGGEPAARRRYLKFVRAVPETTPSSDAAALAAGADESGDRAETAPARGDEESLARIAEDVCAELGAEIEKVRGATRRREVSRARRALIERAVSRGLRPSVVAAFIGRSPAAVSKVINPRFSPTS